MKAFVYHVQVNVRSAAASFPFYRELLDYLELRCVHEDPHTLGYSDGRTAVWLMETDEPYLMISGYRTPQTNRMLRGAASHSYHLKAMAADVRLKSRSVKQISGAAFACNGGGVGVYHRSNFVHMDCGPIRSWRG